jgi:hypothetical protein
MERQVEGWLLNNKLEGMWKEALSVSFEILSLY